MKDISKDVVLTLFLIICSRFILVLSFKHIFNHYRNNPQELSKPYLHESQVRVIQSKMDELETQFKALLSLTYTGTGSKLNDAYKIMLSFSSGL